MSIRHLINPRILDTNPPYGDSVLVREVSPGAQLNHINSGPIRDEPSKEYLAVWNADGVLFPSRASIRSLITRSEHAESPRIVHAVEITLQVLPLYLSQVSAPTERQLPARLKRWLRIGHINVASQTPFK